MRSISVSHLLPHYEQLTDMRKASILGATVRWVASGAVVSGPGIEFSKCSINSYYKLKLAMNLQA